MKENKFEITYEEKKLKDGQPHKQLSELWTEIETIDGVEKVEEFETDSKRIVFFRKSEELKQIDLLKRFENLSFVDWVKKFKKLEVR